MKLALFTVTYCGFWYKGRALSLKEQIQKAKTMGFDAVTIETKRPVAFPADLGQKARKEVREHADSLGVELAAVETMSNFASPIIEDRENNILMVKECMRFANDLGVPIVKIFAAWKGTMRINGLGWYPEEVSCKPSPTHLQQWNWCVEAIRDCAKWAEEYEVTLALQNHPPVINYGYEDALQMVREVDEDGVKLCLDAPLLGRQDEEYVREAVQECRDLVTLSHYGSLEFDEGPSGEIIRRSFQGRPHVNYPTFTRELKQIGYGGVLSSEECSPVLENHQYGSIETVDRHVRAALRYMKKIAAEA